MIDYNRLMAWQFAETVHGYSTDDSMAYALALGLGRDPLDAVQLRFCEDTTPADLQALPTMAVVLGFPGSWMSDPATGIDFSQIVHGEEHVEWHAVLPPAGTVRSRHRMVSIEDKGAGRGAVIRYEKQLLDAATGELYATVVHSTFARANGGFATAAVPGNPPPAAPRRVPDAEPDAVVDIPTLPQQALLYRLLADRNPLHSDPATARAAGFERPILHGLCTWGIAGHALLTHYGDSDPRRMRSMFARFSAPVFPGETLRLEMYGTGADIRFRMRALERGRTVLDFGHARIEQ